MKKYFPFIFLKNFLTGTLNRKRLVENFLSLSVLQALGYLLPLITLPYLVRVLGPEKYGLVIFAQAFIEYFLILVDYGFNFAATRDISINRENKEKINEIFSSVITIKFFIGILSFIILVIILLFVPRFRNDWLVYVFTFGVVLGNILFPVWFFQGIERMRYITILNIIARGIFTICIFIFIRDRSDYLYVPLINSLGIILAGVLSLGVVFKNFKVKFVLPSKKNINYQLKESWHFFISTIATSIYTTSNNFILGLLTNNTIVGYYSPADKIVRAVQSMLTPVSRTIYPYISNLAYNSKQKTLSFIKKLSIIACSGSFIISLILFVFAKPIINLILGNQYSQSIIILKILAFLPLIGLIDTFAIQGLYAFRLQRMVSRFLVPVAFFHIFLLFIMTYFYSLTGTAITVIITEILIDIFSIRYFVKYIIKLKDI